MADEVMSIEDFLAEWEASEVPTPAPVIELAKKTSTPVDTAKAYALQGMGGTLEGISGGAEFLANAAQELRPSMLAKRLLGYGGVPDQTPISDALESTMAMVPEPEGAGQSWVRNASNFLGGSLLPMPGAGITKGVRSAAYADDVLASLAGATGLTAAEEMGVENDAVKAGVTLVSALAPGAARGMATKAFTPQANSRQITNVAKQSLADVGLTADDVSAKAIQVDSDFLPYMTTAEVTENAEAASLLEALQRGTPERSAVMASKVGARRGLRDELLSSLSDQMDISDEAAGEALRSGAKGSNEEAIKQYKKIYNKIDPDETTRIPTDTLKAQLKAIEEDLANPKRGGLALRGTARELSELVSNLDPEVPYQTLRKIKTQAMKTAEKLRQNPDTIEQAPVMDGLASIVDNLVESSEGLNANQQALRQQGDELFKQRIENYTKGKIGRSVMSDTFDAANLPDNLLNASPATMRNLKRITPQQELEQFKGAFARKLIEKSTSAQDNLSLGALKRQLRSKRDSISELFGESHAKRMDRVAADLLSEAKASELGRMASRGNSVTPQGLTNLKAIRIGLSGGKLSKALPIFGEFAEALSNRKAEVIEEVLFKALADPKFANQLLRKANIGWLEANLPTLIGAGRSAGLAQDKR